MKKKIDNETDIDKINEQDENKVEIEYLNDQDPSPEDETEEDSQARGSEGEAGEENLEKMKEELEEAREEAKKFKEEYLRSAAENENLRKRMEREKNEFYQYALSEILKDFLAVLDNFERALESGGEKNGKSFREGIELIYRQYLDVLKKQGVKPVEIEEKRFDPRLHQAFAGEEAEDVDEPEVSEVLQKGYMIHERLLRPSLVKVKIPKKEK
ncbi:MAG: nucleotide exchange factor GrpE [Candidatus Aminicenantes bacterium]